MLTRFPLKSNWLEIGSTARGLISGPKEATESAYSQQQDLQIVCAELRPQNKEERPIYILQKLGQIGATKIRRCASVFCVAAQQLPKGGQCRARCHKVVKDRGSDRSLNDQRSVWLLGMPSSCALLITSIETLMLLSS